jgi:stage V sporulation protein D (sporulation-specific penicillin-binding protein)
MEKRRRFFSVIFCFAAVFVIIVIRLIDLQVIHHAFYHKKSLDQRTRIINLPMERGDILDRNGEILATSVDTYSVFIQKEGFKWLARKLPLEEAEKLRAEDPENYYIFKEKKRVYPKGKFASQTIGFVGMDNQGLSGVELSWDKYLKGKAGQVVTEGDPEGRELFGALREIEPGEEGMNVTLTIDDNIQYIAEREIKRQIRASGAASGMLIVMNARTGEILALASKPDFDPNAFKKFNNRLWHPRFLDPYEPGSTFKVITFASALEEGVIRPDSKVKALDRIEIGGKVIENSHKIKWDGKEVSVSTVLEQSINTGTVQIGLKLGPEKFYDHIIKFGFGETTDCGLYGESRGIVRNWKKWYKPDIGMMTFGQSIAVTPLQLLSALSAFANQGKMVRPYLVKKIESGSGDFIKVIRNDDRGQALSNATVEQMKGLLRNAVLKGSGRRAQMPWFSVGGKTGTAQKALPNGRGYMKGHYIASFIGLAPLKDPQIVALVIVDDPRGSIWGESVCGPVFKNVVEYSLRYLNVKPDMI